MLIAAQKLIFSLVSGTPPVFRSNSFSIVDGSDEPLHTITGIGVGHLRARPEDGDLGFSHLAVNGSWIEGNQLRFHKGKLKPIVLGPVDSVCADVEVDYIRRLQRVRLGAVDSSVPRCLTALSQGVG